MEDWEQEAMDMAAETGKPLRDFHRANEEWNDFDKETVMRFYRGALVVNRALRRADQRLSDRHFAAGPERVVADLHQARDYIDAMIEAVDEQTMCRYIDSKPDDTDILGDDYFFGQSDDAE